MAEEWDKDGWDGGGEEREVGKREEPQVRGGERRGEGGAWVGIRGKKTRGAGEVRFHLSLIHA